MAYTIHPIYTSNNGYKTGAMVSSAQTRSQVERAILSLGYETNPEYISAKAFKLPRFGKAIYVQQTRGLQSFAIFHV